MTHGLLNEFSRCVFPSTAYKHSKEGKLFHDIRSSLRGKMVEEVSYHSSHCRGLLVDQSTGELRFNHTEFKDKPCRHPVGQFIGAKPISEDCESFSIEIVNSMTSSEYIGLGLCHRKYDPDSMVGWDDNSIGYHADDGGIYHEFPFPKDGCQFGYVGDGDVMTCSFDFHEKTVTFLRNGIKVFTSLPLHIPLGGYYPIVCLGINRQIVRLLETQSWLPDTEIVSLSEDLVFHSLYCRDAKISQASGIVRYHSLSPGIPVGQFVSRCSLSPRCNKFSAETVSLGQKSCISIGVCHRCYPSNSQLGWLPNSIAYHVDDGGIYHENGMTLCEGLKARAGDILSCEIDFSTRTCIFQRNGITIYHSPPVTLPPGGFHAAIGFHSPGEAVCLLEKEPWRSQSEELPENPSTPNCFICADNGVTRFLIPCGHTFCVDCIEEWLTRHNSCPVCRARYQDVQKLYF